MSVTSADALEMPVTAKTMATGNWKAPKSATPTKEEMSASAPTFTTKKKMGMMSTGTRAPGQRERLEGRGADEGGGVGRRPDVHYKEEDGDDGRRYERLRLARHGPQRPPRDAYQVPPEARLTRPDAPLPNVDARAGHRPSSSLGLLSSVPSRFPVTSRNTSSRVGVRGLGLSPGT